MDSYFQVKSFTSVYSEYFISLLQGLPKVHRTVSESKTTVGRLMLRQPDLLFLTHFIKHD